MSLPNDDDENSRPPWRDPYGPRDGSDPSSPIKKLTVDSNDADDRTADETSIGSMSFTSDITSVAGTGTATGTANPQRQGRTTRSAGAALDTPLSALTNLEGDDNSIQSGVSFGNTEDSTAIQLRRRRNRRQLQRLGFATGLSFAIFIYMLIPTALLLSMILFGSVSSVFLLQFAEIARWEFHRTILEGRGIGDYLPQGLYELLTTTSLHDILSDPDGIFAASEHIPYLMLYLIPGLTAEQRDHYVSRLSPTYQGLLRNEQGVLGFLINRNNHRLANADVRNNESTLMRVVMGDERLREWRQREHSDAPQYNHLSNIAPRRLELPPTIPEGSEEDAPATTSSRLTPDPVVSQTEAERTEPPPEPPLAGIPETVAAIVGSGDATPNNPPSSVVSTAQSPARRASLTPQSPERRTLPATDMVLFDAVRSAVANVVVDATNAVRESAQESFRDTLATPLYRMSLGVTALGIGMGAFGLANGAYDLRSLAEPIGQLLSNTIAGLMGGSSGSSARSTSRVQLSISMPSGGFLLGSTIASGTTAVVLGLFGTKRQNGGGGSPATKSNGEHKPN